MPLTLDQLNHFRSILETKRDQLIANAQGTLDQDMAFDADDLPDEMDQASTEYLQSFTFRLRGREKVFLEKIELALQKIRRDEIALQKIRDELKGRKDDGARRAEEAGFSNEFGTCEECGSEISFKRLEARPETSLCIQCKEEQERNERSLVSH